VDRVDHEHDPVIVVCASDDSGQIYRSFDELAISGLHLA
jgi:hypothetical protein